MNKHKFDELVVCGGGGKNIFLIKRIAAAINQ